MPIGIWGGHKKPSDLNEFLRPLVNDIDTVINNGIVINGYRLDIQIRTFLLDSPARSFLKGFKSNLNYLFIRV